MIGRSFALARRWAWSPAQTHRWRRTTLSLSALVAAASLVLGWSYLAGAGRIDQHQEDRRPMVVEATGSRPAGELRLVLRGLVWHGVQTPVVWLDGDGDSPVPPGLSRLPRPGSVIVSPAVRSAGFGNQTMGLPLDDVGTGTAGTIGDQGLATRSEWLIYARPSPGRSLGSGGSIYTVRGFADQDGTSWPLAFETSEPGPSRKTAWLVVGLLVLLPVLTLLVTAGGAMSGLLESRFDALERQGLRHVDIARVAVIESACISALPALSGSVLAWVVTRSTNEIPLSGLVLLPGDLTVSPFVIIPTTLAVVAVGALGSLGSTWRGARQEFGISRGRWLVVSRVSVVGLLCAVAALLASRMLHSPTVLLGALALAAVCMSAAVPSLVHRISPPHERESSPHTWLAVRRVAHNPKGLARPAGVLATLILCLLSFTGLQGQLASIPLPESTSAEFPVTVGWRQPLPEDLDLVRRAADHEGLSLTVLPGTPGVQDVKVQGAKPEVDAMVQSIASSLPALNVTDPTAILTERHDAFWYLPWGILATSLFVAASLLAFGNRALAQLREDDDLARAGLDTTDIIRVKRVLLAYPAAVAIALGSGVGLLFLWCAESVQLTVTSLGLVSVEVVTVSAMTAAMIRLLERWS